MNARIEAKLVELPARPGVYFHKSATGEIIYVGKAAVLRNRVRQYFQSSRGHDNKTLALVAEIDDVDWVETESEVDALFLESEMVKRYMPRYNVLLRDDKSQMFVRIDMKSEWPHVSFTRNPADDGAEYYGPFYNGYALKKALRYLRSIYPYYIRQPKDTDSRLETQIGMSPVRSDGPEAYKANLRKLISYIKGNRVALARELEDDMKRAADRHDFERAAQLRNKLHGMRELQRRVMFGDREFLDISKDQALAQLTDLLSLPSIPKRIEGYDISHQGGQNVVASMVVFTNGVSDRAEYRKFKMARQANNDVANMHDTLYRRLSEKHLKGWGTPDLILIDGGKGQLDAAIRAQQARGTAIPIVSIAKREEELLIAKQGSEVLFTNVNRLQQYLVEGVRVSETAHHYVINLHVGQRNAGSHSKNLRAGETQSPYLDLIKLFQRIRDEAHRFAVSYHSVLKVSTQTKSRLDDIPGVGPATRKKLLAAFGSLRQIAQASQIDIEQVIGRQKASSVYRYLQSRETDDTLTT